MSWGEIIQSAMLSLGIVFVTDLIVGPMLGRAIKLLGQPVSEIQTPSHLTHRQPGSISERAGEGGVAGHLETATTTEMDQ